MLTFNFSDVILLKMPQLIEELSRRAFHNRRMSSRAEIECEKHWGNVALKNTIVPAMLSDSAHSKIAQVGDMMC